MRGKARWMMVVVVALAASLTLAACDGSDDGEAAADGSGGEAPAMGEVEENSGAGDGVLLDGAR